MMPTCVAIRRALCRFCGVGFVADIRLISQGKVSGPPDTIRANALGREMNSCKTRSFLSSLTAKPHSLKPLAGFLTRLVENREEREKAGLFFCDGLRAVYRAIASPHFPPELFVYSPDIFYRHPGADRVRELLQERCPNVPLVSLPADLMRRLSQAPEPQGIGAVVGQTWTPLYRLPPDAGLCYLALDSVRNTGNLGTVLRTLEAVGGAGLICLPPDMATNPDEPAADPFAPGVVRAGMGSTFALRFARVARNESEEWRRWRQKHDVLLVGTSPHTGDDYRSIRYGERVVLWIGGERKGLSDAQMSACDRLVRIPMAPAATADSLNLATAASILLYELFNQQTPIG